jgi:hypothetical protein
VWSGDVWRFAEFLMIKRRDLRLSWFDTAPTGILVSSRLDPDSRVLWEDYNMAVCKWTDAADAPVLEQVLARVKAAAPAVANLREAAGR